MIKLENFEVVGWEHAIRGMRNPKNSWDRMDTHYCGEYENCDGCPALDEGEVCTVFGTNTGLTSPIVGPNDHGLMMDLVNGGPVHAKYRRMIDVYVDITAPLYWWKEFDTYKVGTVANSCSTMHKIHAKEFTEEDFSMEHLTNDIGIEIETMPESDITDYLPFGAITILQLTIDTLNVFRDLHNRATDPEAKKKYFKNMIQLLPSSYNQKRTIKMNYEVLANIYKWRKNHKLDEWVEMCKWIEQLPYSEVITGAAENDDSGIRNGEVGGEE